MLLYWLCVSRRTVGAIGPCRSARVMFSRACRTCFIRKASQVVDPAQQYLFVVTLRFDALAARVFHPFRRLPQQQRLLWIPPVDQVDERKSERLDLSRNLRRARGIRVVSRRRHRCRYGTVRTVAAWSSGIHRLDEERLIHGRSCLRDVRGVTWVNTAATIKAANSTRTGRRIPMNFLPRWLKPA